MLRRIAVRLTKDALRLRYHGEPVPLDTFVRLRRFAGRPNAVTYRAQGRPHDARDVLRNSFLSERLAGVELGNWTLSGAVLNVPETEIQRGRPDLVLEFGSGVSTACLARYAHEAHGDKRLRVASIEDGEEFAAETERRLEELGLAGVARVFQAPLAEQRHRGRTLVGYTLPEELTDLLRQRPPGLVLIDGPGTGPTGSRYSSLVAVRPFLRPSTRFFLDDALEDYGLLVAGGSPSSTTSGSTASCPSVMGSSSAGSRGGESLPKPRMPRHRVLSRSSGVRSTTGICRVVLSW